MSKLVGPFLYRRLAAGSPWCATLGLVAAVAMLVGGCQLELCCDGPVAQCSQPEGDLGERCVRDEECQRGLVCFEEICREAGVVGAGCKESMDCAAALVCSCEHVECTGECNEPGTIPLGEHCGSDEACESGICNRALGSVCQEPAPAGSACLDLDSSDCAGGLVCNWGYTPHVCREPELEGGLCLRAEDCAIDHVCQWVELDDGAREKRCVARSVSSGDPCESDDCGHALVCDEFRRICTEAAGLGGPCRGIPCAGDGSCNYGIDPPICVEPGAALAGEPCSDGGHCAPGLLCGDDVCQAPGFRHAGEGCRSDEECGAPLRCASPWTD